MSEETTVEETGSADATEATASVNLGLNDIIIAANIIDLATQRGAFKAAEAGQVGATFNKLVAFVKATQEASAANEDNAEEASTEEAASEEA